MANRIQLRRDTAANWTTANPILSEGEVGIETDGLNTTEVKRKIGDGVTAWGALEYDGITYYSRKTDPQNSFGGNNSNLSTTLPSEGKYKVSFTAKPEQQVQGSITQCVVAIKTGSTTIYNLEFTSAIESFVQKGSFYFSDIVDLSSSELSVNVEMTTNNNVTLFDNILIVEKLYNHNEINL